MTKRVRVNVRALANTKAVRRERRNGRDVIIVPSATLPDDVIMNGIKYPAAEIEKGFKSLERTPAPLGHPTINGKFVSASDPDGLNLGWIGAHNENVRRQNGRVFLDKVIDVQRATESAGGKSVLDAIDQGDPVHTSTGVFLDLEASNADDCEYIARNMRFDHDAILLGEEGAATPDQGVGMMVNAKGELEKIEVINSALEDAERELDWAADMAVRAAERMARVPLMERIKTAIMEAVLGSERETSHNAQENDMAVTDEQFNALSDEVKTLSENLKGLGDTITNAVTDAVKPLKDHVDQLAANQKAEEDAKRAAAVNTLTKGGQWTEADLEGMTLTALNKLVEKSKPGTAAALNSAFPGAGDGAPAFKLPKGEEVA